MKSNLVTHYINDEETVKLIHETFPDNDKSNNTSSNFETNKTSIEKNIHTIKSNQKFEDTDLVKQLKKEHTIISKTLVELQEYGVTSPKGMDLLLKSKELLLNHLKLEDDKLYPKLKEHAQIDNTFNKVLNDSVKEMNEITEFVLNFYSKYSDKSKISEKNFLKDITKFIVTLKDRVAKEEAILYNTYNKVLNK